MTRHILVVEPDASGQALLDRVLTAAGYAVEGFESAYDARILLDDGAFDLALVDQLAGTGAALDEARFLRAHYPRLPIVVTGTMLTATVMLELLRLGVADALPKPFTPGEVRDAAAHALARAAPHCDEALDYAAAIGDARRHLATGHPARAAAPLARAWSNAPLDADVVCLEALRAELEGRDADASRGYRATLALRHDEGGDGPDPHEGIARLSAYGAARPVEAFGEKFRDAPLWIVTDPTRALDGQPPDGVNGPVIVAIALALLPEGGSAVYLREGVDRAFALLASDLRPERAGAPLARVGAGLLVADDTSLASGLDLPRLTDARDGATRLVKR